MLPLWFLPVLAAGGGCGKKIWVAQYPDFHTPQLRRIVVAPFHNATDHPQAGRILTDRVAMAMVANGTYEVLTPADLKAALGPGAGATEADAAELARRIRRDGTVQAILTGTVTAYSAQTHRERRRLPVYARDRKGRILKDRIVSWREVDFIRHEAVVDATARLIATADGRVLHATAPGLARSKVVSATDEKTARPPQTDLAGCLAAATDQAVAKLMEEFAVVRKQVRVGRGALKTAAGIDEDGEWDFAGKFRRSDERLYVVLRLPDACDRNRFRLTIVAKESGAEIADVEVVWRRQWGEKQGRGFAFSPGEIAAAGGEGDYRAVLHCCDGEPVLEAKFRIGPAED